MTLQKKCFGWKGTNGLGETSLFLSCAEFPGWKINPIYSGGYSYPTDNGVNITGKDSYGTIPEQLILLKDQADIDNWLNGATATGSCDTCLGDCPPGTHKCTHDKYPGYCCVPCKEVAQRINSITTKVGRG